MSGSVSSPMSSRWSFQPGCLPNAPKYAAPGRFPMKLPNFEPRSLSQAIAGLPELVADRGFRGCLRNGAHRPRWPVWSGFVFHLESEHGTAGPDPHLAFLARGHGDCSLIGRVGRILQADGDRSAEAD